MASGLQITPTGIAISSTGMIVGVDGSVCCCAGGCPPYDEGAQSSSYSISIPSLDDCLTCKPATIEPSWDGSFIDVGTSGARQSNADDDDYTYQIGGFVMRVASIGYVSPLAGSHCWLLAIICRRLLGSVDIAMWQGYKDSGTTFAGTYTYDSGCSSGPATITVT